MVIHIANPIYDSVFKYLMENEFFSAIENRDTAIMACDKKIKEQDSLISEQSNTISEQNDIITEQNDLLKKMVMSMLARGMTIKDIDVVTGRSAEDIRRILAD